MFNRLILLVACLNISLLLGTTLSMHVSAQETTHSNATMRAFVGDWIGGTVHVIDMKTGEVIDPARELGAAHLILGCQNKLFFINPMLVTVVDKSGLNTVFQIDFDGYFAPGSCEAVVSPDGSKMYIAGMGWGKGMESGIYLIDLIKKQQTGVLLKNAITTGIAALSDDGKRFYSSCSEGLAIIDTENNVVVDKVAFAAGERAIDIAALSKDIVCLVIYKTNDKANIIRVLNTADKSRREITVNEDIYKITADDKKRYLYSANATKIIKLDITNLKVLGQIEFEASNITYSSNSNYLVAVSTAKNQMAIIDTHIDKIIHTITIGDQPYGVYAE